MMGIRRALSQSLATKVILSTVLLSLGVISLVGSALNSRLSDGLRSAAFNSAISESKFTFFDAEYKLAISRDSTTEARKKILADIVVNATTQVVKEARREIIFLKVPTNTTTKVSYEMASVRIKSSSIPAELRKRVVSGAKIESEFLGCPIGIVERTSMFNFLATISPPPSPNTFILSPKCFK